jgi:hypothetical protein
VIEIYAMTQADPRWIVDRDLPGSRVAWTIFSAFWLATMSWIEPGSSFTACLSVQLVAGVVALPVWRLLLDRATRARLDTGVLRLAA